MDAEKAIVLGTVISEIEKKMVEDGVRILEIGREKGYKDVNQGNVLADILPVMKMYMKTGETFREFGPKLLDEIVEAISPRSKEENAIFAKLLEDIIQATHESIVIQSSALEALNEMKQEELSSLFREIEDQPVMAGMLIRLHQQKFGELTPDMSKVQAKLMKVESIKKADLAADALLSAPLLKEQVETLLLLPVSKTVYPEEEHYQYFNAFMKKLVADPEAMAEALSISDAPAAKKEKVFELFSNAILSVGIDKMETCSKLIEMAFRTRNIAEAIEYLKSSPSEQEEKDKSDLAKDGKLLEFFKNQTDELCRIALAQNGLALEHVKNQTDELCRIALAGDGRALQFVKNQTDELCMVALAEDDWALRFVKNQTDELCRIAMAKNGWALEYVENQTDEICRIALAQNGWGLEYVENQTDELCRIAIAQKNSSFIYVKNQTDELCRTAVAGGGGMLGYVQPQYHSKELFIMAVAQKPNIIRLVEEIVAREIRLSGAEDTSLDNAKLSEMYQERVSEIYNAASEIREKMKENNEQLEMDKTYEPRKLDEVKDTFPIVANPEENKIESLLIENVVSTNPDAAVPSPK